VKQVIVIRKDLKMRRGKEIAQGAHAAMKWLSDRLYFSKGYNETHTREMAGGLSDAEFEWLEGSFTKVCVQVDSKEELLDVYRSARALGIVASLITDAGLTEFSGVPTETCCAIGPDYAERVDEVTGHLKLY